MKHWGNKLHQALFFSLFLENLFCFLILLKNQNPSQLNSEEIHYVLIKQVQFFLFFTLLISDISITDCLRSVTLQYVCLWYTKRKKGR